MPSTTGMSATLELEWEGREEKLRTYKAPLKSIWKLVT